MGEATDDLIQLCFERTAEIRVFDGILQVLENLQAQGCRLSIWTGREKLTALEILRSTGTDKYFSDVVTRDCVKNFKPHPEGLLKILSAAGTKSKNALMVGDHIMDLEGARAAEVDAIHAIWNGTAPSLNASKSSFQVKQPKELENWFKNHHKEE